MSALRTCVGSRQQLVPPCTGVKRDRNETWRIGTDVVDHGFSDRSTDYVLAHAAAERNKNHCPSVSGRTCLAPADEAIARRRVSHRVAYSPANRYGNSSCIRSRSFRDAFTARTRRAYVKKRGKQNEKKDYRKRLATKQRTARYAHARNYRSAFSTSYNWYNTYYIYVLSRIKTCVCVCVCVLYI